jgi:hypothetical protein
MKKELLKEGTNSAATFLANKLDSPVAEIKGSMIFEKLSRLDPSPTKKYLDWIVRSLVEMTEDGGKFTREAFHNVYSAMYSTFSNLFRDFYKFTEDRIITGKEADINSYSYWRELDDAIKKAKMHNQERLIRRYSKKDVEVREDAELILSTDSYFIVRPDSTGASIFYGKNTPWCVSLPGNEHFDNYRRFYINMYMIIITNPKVLRELEKIYKGTEGIENLTKKLSKVAIIVDRNGSIDHPEGHWHGENERFSAGIGPYLEHLQINPKIFKALTEEQYQEAQEIWDERQNRKPRQSQNLLEQLIRRGYRIKR